MSQPRKESSGFGNSAKRQTSKAKPSLNPADQAAKEHQAVALINRGKLQDAEVIYKQLIAVDSQNHINYCNLASIYGMQGKFGECIELLKKALEIDPSFPEAHFNLGNAFKDQGDLISAIISFTKALELRPNYLEAQLNLGNALNAQGDLTAAITSFKKALELRPNHPQAHYNLGNALKEGRELTDAIASYRSALQLKPNYPEAIYNLSLTMLLGKDYKNGLEKYEWRFKKSEEPIRPHAIPKCDLWDGELAFNQSNQLLVVSEQGLGDTLQFMRYVNALKQQGTNVSLCAQPKLHSLIQTSGIDASPLTPTQANQVADGQWTPLLSIPRYLNVNPSNPIVTEPYIKTTGPLVAKWASILKEQEEPIIGINWQGNPKAEKTGLRGRSLKLESFAPITADSAISLVSLQKGYGSEQLDNCSFKDRFVSCQDQVNDTWDFLETAAIIANCDLVITSDTSVAHLAGGMGKTTWLLLHQVPDWRWGLEGDTTFWYPSMRLFRQKEKGNWDEVMQRVAEALQKHFANSSIHPDPAIATQPSIKPKPIQHILAPISLGELVDKITILQIKTQHLQGNALEHVQQELEALELTLNKLQLNIDPSLIQRLKKVNQDLWHIEDAIRDQERRKSFGENFVQLARSVYQQNDHRSAIKKEINTTYGSAFTEEKSYQQY